MSEDTRLPRNPPTTTANGPRNGARIDVIGFDEERDETCEFYLKNYTRTVRIVYFGNSDWDYREYNTPSIPIYHSHNIYFHNETRREGGMEFLFSLKEGDLQLDSPMCSEVFFYEFWYNITTVIYDDASLTTYHTDNLCNIPAWYLNHTRPPDNTNNNGGNNPPPGDGNLIPPDIPPWIIFLTLGLISGGVISVFVIWKYKKGRLGSL